MACIHYKFKNSLDFDSITFDGLHISVRDLKEAIMQRKKLNDSDMDLLIINALNAKAYKDEEEMIPKNASVIVARIPLSDAPKSKGPKTLNAYKEDPKPQPQVQMPNPTINKDNLAEAADLVTAKGSEEDKIKAMMKQSTKDFDPANYQKKYPTGTPSPSYVCFKCNKTGHFIHNCPNAAVVSTEASGSPKTGEIDAKRIKRPTGIPYTFLTTTAKSEPGAMLLGDGRYAVPTIDQEAFKKGKKERPPFLPAPVEKKKEEVAVPTELTCLLCKDLVTDAVVIPCCGNSYCDECIRNHLIEDEDHKCPTCHEENVSPDKLIINKSLRTSVNNFKNETLYQKREKNTTPPPPPPPPPKTTSSTVIGSPLKLDTSMKPIDLTAEEPETPLQDENSTSEDIPKGIAVLSGRQAITTDTDQKNTTTPAVTSASSSYRPTESKSTESFTPQAPIPSLGTTGYRPHGPPVSLPNTALPPPGYRPPLLYPPSLVPPPPPFAVPPGFIPPQVSKPLSEQEFYRAKQRLLGKPNPLDDYTRPLDKEAKKRSRSKSPRKRRTRSRSRSRTPKDGPRKKSYSRTPPPKKRSYTKSRSRSPFRKKSYTRSRSRSPRPRSRSRLRSRSITPRPRSRSWTPKKFRRSYTRSRTRSRTRSPRYRKTYSRSPPPRRRSYSRSLTPLRRSYSRSPPPRRRSKSPYYRGRPRSPGYSGYGGRDWSPPPPYRGYRSPPPRGFSPPRYGSGPPPYNYGGRNDDYNARFDKRIYEEIFQDYLARFGLPPPPPPPAGQLERGMYYDPRKGVYRKRSRSRSPRSKRSDKNKDRKDEKSSRNKDKKTNDKSKSRTKKDDEKTKRGEEKTKGKEEKATSKDKENKTKKPDEKREAKVEKPKETEQKAVEKKVVKKVTKVKSKEEGTVVKKESIALRLKTKAGAGKSPVKLGKPKVVRKEAESSNAALQAINRTGALKTIATTDNIKAPKENVYAMRKNSNLLEINTRSILPELQGTEKPKVSDKTMEENEVSNTDEKEAKVLNKIEKEAKVQPMETEEPDEKKDSVSLKSEEKNEDQGEVKDESKVAVKKKLVAPTVGPSSPTKKVKVTKKVKRVKKLVEVDASQSDSASDMDKAKIRTKKRVSEINENEDESPAKRLKPDSADEKDMEQTDNKAKDEDQLMLSPPELSKWERDDYNEDKSPDLREKLKKKVEKKPLPRSVIESAEKAITQKQPKPATVASAIVPAHPQKKLSVHDRLQKSPVRQTDSSLQKSPIKNDHGKKSPVRQQRRVYMDGEKQNQKAKEEEENRRVRSRESSMQITISSDKKRGEKDSDVGKKYKTETNQRRVSESEKSDRHKVSVNEKSDKFNERSEKRKQSVDEKSDKLSKHRTSESDKFDEKDRDKKEKVKSKSVENGIKHDKKINEKKEKRSNEKVKTDEKENTANDDEKNVSNGQKEDTSKLKDETEKQPIKKKKYERKESIVDESTFVPDYNEHTDSDGESEGEVSSASHVDDDDKKSDKDKEEKKHKKHKKEKKNKKNKKHKHKHKKKKHKKHKEEKESSEKGD